MTDMFSSAMALSCCVSNVFLVSCEGFLCVCQCSQWKGTNQAMCGDFSTSHSWRPNLQLISPGLGCWPHAQNKTKMCFHGLPKQQGLLQPQGNAILIFWVVKKVKPIADILIVRPILWLFIWALTQLDQLNRKFFENKDLHDSFQWLFI